MPFKFIALDTLSTIKGFNDDEQSGYWSNEVRNINADTLVVRTKKGICAKGNYEQVITHRDCKGARYCQSVYIAYVDGKDMKIGNIQITGAALSAWIDFRKKNKIFGSLITVADMVEGKKGATVYKVPVFTLSALKPEVLEKATKMDVELQEYLTKYFAKTVRDQSSQVAEKAAETEKVEMSPVVKEAIKQEGNTGAPISLMDVDDNMPF